MRNRLQSLALLGCWLAAGAGFSIAEKTMVSTDQSPGGEDVWSQSAGAAAVWVADWSWVQAYAAWERRDPGQMRDWLRVVRAAQPGNDYFLHNAARMLAFDVPAWRCVAEPNAPEAVQSRWRSEAGREAIAWLAPERRERVATWIEAGNIALHAVRDPGLAADHYGRAARLPQAPWFVGRIHVRLLLASGRPADAVAFLRDWVPQLPDGTPDAQRREMEALLAELERRSGREGF
jgi:hypothetical protein